MRTRSESAPVPSLPDLLHRYEGLWAELGCPAASLLRPGVAAERVREALRGEGLPAPGEVLAWFGWHDGAERVGLVLLPPPRLMVLSLEQALFSRRRLLAFAQESATELRDTDTADELKQAQYWWREGWLPVAQHGSGDTLAVDLSAGGDAPALRYWAAESPDLAQEPAAPSLSAAVAYWVSALESGACRWDAAAEHPHWEVDRSRLPPAPAGLSPFLMD